MDVLRTGLYILGTVLIYHKANVTQLAELPSLARSQASDRTE